MARSKVGEMADLREAESLQDNGDLAWLQDG